MKKTSRHHHYLSQCYLRGFTKSGSKKSKLTVLDLNREKVFQTNPRNVGGVRDFDRINADGVDPDIINQNLSGFETQVASSLRRVERDLKFEGEDKENILNLIALLSARSPQRREHWRKFREQSMKRMLDMMLYSKERWEAQSEKIDIQEGRKVGKISYEEAKEFHERGDYKILLSNAHHLEMEMVAIDTILPLLAERKWILLKTSEDAGSFISTDNPVFLVWKHIDKIPPLYQDSPGHGMKDTQIQFPISRKLTLIGEFEGNEGVVEIDKMFVALLNSKMLISLHERVFAPNIHFNYVDFMGNNSTILNGSHLISYVKKYKPN